MTPAEEDDAVRRLRFLLPGIIRHVRYRRDPAWDAADLVSEGLVGILKGIRSHNPNRGKLESWVIAVTTHHLHNFGKWSNRDKRRRTPERIVQAWHDAASKAEDKHSDPWDRLGPNAPLHVLSPSERFVIEAVYIRGISRADAAQQRRCTRQNISNLDLRALAKMRHELLRGISGQGIAKT